MVERDCRSACFTFGTANDITMLPIDMLTMTWTMVNARERMAPARNLDGDVGREAGGKDVWNDGIGR